MYWRLLVKESIVTIEKLRHPFHYYLAPRPIQSISYDVHLYVVPSWKPRFLMDLRTLVKERIANIG